MRAHLTRIYRHIGVDDRTQAALWAVEHGMGRRVALSGRRERRRVARADAVGMASISGRPPRASERLPRASPGAAAGPCCRSSSARAAPATVLWSTVSVTCEPRSASLSVTRLTSRRRRTSSRISRAARWTSSAVSPGSGRLTAIPTMTSTPGVAQRPRDRLDRALEVLHAVLLRAQVDEQLAHPGHRARGSPRRRGRARARRSSSEARGQRRGRVELVGGAGEVLDDALVELGRDPPALGLERVLGLAGELLAVARVGARPPRLRPDERQLRGGEREEEAEEHRQERAPDAVARRVDLAGRVVGLDQDEAARREPQREVDLDELAVAALEPVLRARQVADVGADRVVGERGAQVLRAAGTGGR